MKKKNGSIFYIKTVYSLMLALILDGEKINEKYFILDKKIPKKIRENILNRWNGIEVEEKFSQKSLFKYYFKYKLAKKIKKDLKNMSKDSIVYGYIGSTFLGDLLKEKFDYRIVEDGIANYNIKEIKKRKLQIVDYILGGSLYKYPGYGACKRVNKIYLTGIGEIPNLIKNNVELISLKNLWQKKSRYEKEKILEIFAIDLLMLNKLKKIKNILFTQPLSEDGIISEYEKIEIYREVINQYNEELVLIKPHPRELTNYNNFASNTTVMEKDIPFELLNLVGVKIEKAITLFSSVVFSLNKDIKIDFYGTKINSKIYKKFGSLENIKIDKRKLNSN